MSYLESFQISCHFVHPVKIVAFLFAYIIPFAVSLQCKNQRNRPHLFKNG